MRPPSAMNTQAARRSGPVRPDRTRPAGLAGLVLDPATAARQGGALLDPARWGRRHRWALLAGLLTAVAAGVTAAARSGSAAAGPQSVRAFLAAAAGLAMIWLAASLRGATLPGFVVGGLYVAAGMASWAYLDVRGIVWGILVVEGLLFATWSFPWARDLARLPRLGAAWLGLAYWLLGVLGAALVWHPTVAYQRLAYLGVFTLGALAVVVATRKSGRDLSIGIVAAFLVALALLFLVGSGNALGDTHPAPDNAWGAHMHNRFWGGPGLLYHPNSIALVAVVVGIRIAGDRAFERWQRYAALAVTTLVLLLVNSRTGLLYLAAAAVVWAVLVLAARRTGREVAGMDRFPGRRAAIAVALLPIALVVLIVLGSGGIGFLTVQRYGATSGGLTSGRMATWRTAWREFVGDDIVQKTFGDTKYARGYVVRPGSDAKLTTDNAAVGALRRGGVLGAAAFLVGLVLLVGHATRGRWRRRPGGGPGRATARSPGGEPAAGVPGAREPDAGEPGAAGPPAWFTAAAVGSVFTIPTADWLLGNTGGTLWIFLLAGEAYLIFIVRGRVGTAPDSADPATAG